MPSDFSRRDGFERFQRFLRGDSPERHFSWPTCHPARPTGFCPCDWPIVPRFRAYLRGFVLLSALHCPGNAFRIAMLRRFAARIGKNVYLSAGTWIDPAFPQLLTVEDDVLIGVGVRVAMHEFGANRFRAGRVVIRRGAVIGGFALLGPGVEIGENAVVAGGAVVGRDLPPGMVAMGNPARVVPQKTELATDAASAQAVKQELA